MPRRRDRSDMSADHLVLVGLMGSGKSSVGRRVADALGRPFVDTDQRVERREGRTIRDIFATDGEAVFRDIESSVLVDVLSSTEPAVIATGGGIVTRSDNRDLLAEGRDSGVHVVWLRATVDTLAARLAAGASRRPLLDGDVRGHLTELDERRRDLYGAVASEVVDVDDRTLDDVVSAVLAATESR
jgi:shikimate kinase